MSTSKKTFLNLDELVKKVGDIVDEQINELGSRKNTGVDKQFMKEDFARGNPFSRNSKNEGDPLSGVAIKLRGEEDRKVVSNLADRLKDSIGRAVDEFSEGLYNQIKIAPCKCDENGCHNNTKEMNSTAETSEITLSPDEAQVVDPSPPEVLQNAQTEEVGLDHTPPEPGDTVDLSSVPVAQISAAEEVVETSEEVVETSDYPTQQPVTESLSVPAQSLDNGPEAPSNLAPEENTQEIIPEENTQEIVPEENTQVVAAPIPDPTPESVFQEETTAIPQSAEGAQTPPPAPLPEEPQQNLFSSTFDFGQNSQPAAAEASCDTAEVSAPEPEPEPEPDPEPEPAPSDDSSSNPMDKGSKVVSKTASDMSQINQQRLDQYFAKKTKYSL